MNSDAANRKAINLIDRISNIANAWLDTNDRHALVNYFLNKINTEE